MSDKLTKREMKEDNLLHRGARSLIRSGIKRDTTMTKLDVNKIVEGCAIILKKRYGPRTIHSIIVE